MPEQPRLHMLGQQLLAQQLQVDLDAQPNIAQQGPGLSRPVAVVHDVLDPADVQPARGLAIVAWERGDIDAAYQTLSQAVAVSPRDVDVLYYHVPDDTTPIEATIQYASTRAPVGSADRKEAVPTAGAWPVR